MLFGGIPCVGGKPGPLGLHLNPALLSHWQSTWSDCLTRGITSKTIQCHYNVTGLCSSRVVALMMRCGGWWLFEGFNELSATDQGTLIRLGQSQSRILVAALHWYDSEENNFRHFLSWRIMPPGQTDQFRQKLIDYSKRIHTLELDPIEAALLNVLVIIASGKLN